MAKCKTPKKPKGPIVTTLGDPILPPKGPPPPTLPK